MDNDLHAVPEMDEAALELNEDVAENVNPAGEAAFKDAQISEIKKSIESGREQIEHLEAFAEMERAKLENDPDYETSFLEEALAEQEKFRNAVDLGEKRLKDLTQSHE